MKHTALAAISVVIFNLSGCSSAPNCSSEEVKSLAKQILSENPNMWVGIFGAKIGFLTPKNLIDHIKSEATFDLSNIRMDGLDKDTNKMSCSADVKVNLPIMDSEEVRHGEISVQYTAQKNSEGQTYVELGVNP